MTRTSFFFYLLLFYFFLFMSVAYLTLFERHLLGMSQLRCGPNKTILKGIFQPLLDALKLMQKEFLVLYKSSDFYYIMSPMMMFLIFFFFWYSSPYMFMWASFINSILFFFCLVGISVYMNFMGGYYSGSKYSYLGAMRAVAQSISFEVSFFFLLLCYINLVLKYEFSISNIMFMCPLFYPWIMSIVVELGRAPLDFMEGESELVSGYNVEYSGTLFIFWFLSEYGFLLWYSVLSSKMFFNWSGLPVLFFYFITWLLLFFRSCLPRYRYDKLMAFFWGSMLPISMFIMFFYYIMCSL